MQHPRSDWPNFSQWSGELSETVKHAKNIVFRLRIVFSRNSSRYRSKSRLKVSPMSSSLSSLAIVPIMSSVSRSSVLSVMSPE
jgi:hypothetical protein